MPKLIQATSTTLRVTIVGAFLIAVAFIIAGIWLVYLGASGQTSFKFFGQEFSSTNVGIAALFLGAVTVVLLLRRSLATLDNVVRLESVSGSEPEQDVPGWPSVKSKRSLHRAIHSLSGTQWAILEAIAQSEGALGYTLSSRLKRVGPSEFHYRMRGLVEDDFVASGSDKVYLSESVRRIIGDRGVKELRRMRADE